jgi:hypothetical protein
MKNPVTIRWDIWSGRELLGCLVLGGRIISEWILNKLGGRIRTGLIWHRAVSKSNVL